MAAAGCCWCCRDCPGPGADAQGTFGSILKLQHLVSFKSSGFLTMMPLGRCCSFAAGSQTTSHGSACALAACC